MTTECSTCNTNFDLSEEGITGSFGMIPVAFCGDCLTCLHDFAGEVLGLVPDLT